MFEPIKYVTPLKCDYCHSENLLIAVNYESRTTGYTCGDCGHYRQIPKEENIKRRGNSSESHWAKEILRYHRYCQICGSRENLEAHHIIPVSNSERYRFDYANGIALCKDCHYLVHNKEKVPEKKNS